MIKAKRCCVLLIYAFFTLALASLAYASYDGFSDIYYRNFNEGDERVFDLVDLDIVRFTYSDTNYSVRLMGIYSETVRIIVTQKYFDLQLNDPLDIDLDGDDEGDISIELEYMDHEQAGLRIVLNEIEVEEPEENITNTTNTTSTNTTNTSNTSSQNQDNNSNHNNNNNESQNTTTTSNSNEQNTDTESSNDNSKKTPEVTGDVVYNIEIDISIPPGSGIGVLLIIAIVLGGLFAYKKVKKRVGTEDEGIDGTVREKRVKKSPKTAQKEPIKAADMKKAFKKFMKKTGKTITKSRKRVAEMIAGDNFVRKPKT